MQTAWVSVSGRNELQFQVKACSNVRVLLSMFVQLRHTSSYEFFIGHDNNQKTSLWREGQQVSEFVKQPDCKTDKKIFCTKREH